MVLTRHIEGRTEVRHTKLFHLGFRHLQRFHAIAHLLWRDLFGVVDFLRVFRRFNSQHRRVHAPVIKDGSGLIASARRFTRIVDVFFQIVIKRIIIADAMEVQRLIAIGLCANGNDIILGTGPPDADEVFHRIANVRRFLNGGRVHHTPTPHRHIVRLGAANLQPLRFLLLAGVIDGQKIKLKAMLFRQLFERADRLLTVGRVVIDQRQRLALDVTIIDFQQVVHNRRRAIPIVGRIVKDGVEHLAVRRRGPAISHRVQRDTIRCGFRNKLIGNAGR